MSCENNSYTRTPPELDFQLLSTCTLEDVNNNAFGWSSEEIQKQRQSTDILLISDDDTFLACYSYMKQIRRGYCEKLGMVDFGRFGDENDGNVKVALMRRSNVANDTQRTVHNAAGELCPKVALLVGICETMKPERAKLGDVAISAKLATYDNMKFRSDGTVKYPGPKTDVSRNMAKLIVSAADGWKPPLKNPISFEVKVHRDALVLSGSDCIEDQKILEILKKDFSDALVIEIGGIGR
jgi:hypothetical protein